MKELDQFTKNHSSSSSDSSYFDDDSGGDNLTFPAADLHEDDEIMLQGFPQGGEKTNRCIDQMKRNKKQVIGGTILAIFGIISLTVLIVMWGLPSDSDNDHTSTDTIEFSSIDSIWIDHLSDEQTLHDLASEMNSLMHSTVDPCDDFYQYACGAWLDEWKEKIPADKSSYARSFTSIDDNNEALLFSILEANWPMIGTFYRNCMDNQSREALRTTPLDPIFEDIDQSDVSSLSTLFGLIGRMHSQGFPALFSFYVEPDMKDPSLNMIQLDQGGFGLGPRDYWFSNEPRYVQLRQNYTQSVRGYFELIMPNANNDRIDQAVTNTLMVERALASFSMTPTERRDPNLLYHPLTFVDLHLDQAWQAYFTNIGAHDILSLSDTVNCANMAFIGNVSLILRDRFPLTDQDDQVVVRDYLKYKVTSSSASLLSTPFQQVHFHWLSAKYGIQEMPSQNKQCLSMTNAYLGDLLGRYFVAESFPESSKTLAQDLIDRIEREFSHTIDESDWMTEPTKARAQLKLNAITNKIGYPDEWIDQSALYIRPGAYFDNVIAAEKFQWQRSVIDKIVNRQVDKNEWFMNPQTVNAYFEPTLNEMVFPAAILMPPFFNQSYPAPMNFGGIGMVAGHELSHSEDDQGMRFDELGRLNMWWDESSLNAFNERSQCVVDLYNGFGLNGKNTLGENIADQGGIKGAYRAYKQLSKELNLEKAGYNQYIEQIFDHTPEQLLFVSFAQNWCTVYRPEYLDNLIATNPHSPARWRVIGTLQSTPQFAKVFQCPVDSVMNPSHRCGVW